MPVVPVVPVSMELVPDRSPNHPVTTRSQYTWTGEGFFAQMQQLRTPRGHGRTVGHWGICRCACSWESRWLVGVGGGGDWDRYEGCACTLYSLRMKLQAPGRERGKKSARGCDVHISDAWWSLVRSGCGMLKATTTGADGGAGAWRQISSCLLLSLSLSARTHPGGQPRTTNTRTPAPTMPNGALAFPA